VGMRARLSGYMIIAHVFGVVGAKVVNLCFGLALLGWYAVTAEFFGHTLWLAAADYGLTILPRWAWISLSSVLVIVTTVYGFRALDRLALFAVPLLALCLTGVMIASLADSGLDELLARPAGDMPFSRGVSVVIGTMIIGVVLMPDFTRYARNLRDCLTASFLGNTGGIVLSTTLAMVPSLHFGLLDPMSYLTAMGIGGLALGLLVFATWTTNGANLYSVGLVVGSATARVSYGQVVLATGVVGTLAAIGGVAEHFIEFLEILGLIVPPVAGVYLTRFFLLGRRDFSTAHLHCRPPVVWPALLATLLGGGLASLLWFTDSAPSGIPACESLLASAGLYLALDRLLPAGDPQPAAGPLPEVERLA